MDFDASGALGAELEAFTESDLLLSHCLLASNDLKMSINESGSPVTEDELLILKASTKHSLATSIPSASTPGLGSTIQHKPKPKSKSKSKPITIHCNINNNKSTKTTKIAAEKKII
jgi:hypothetical protein